ncbi:MAG: hypothetical protein PHE68_03350 [Candidatus Peribacteraceae bacterium]|nr:hypothetical protein [Candidatus Peribacteraceae bacterium]MDD5075055.1 hypothetical protein [Candidatus Peribacteraceae bacterium]
MHRLFTPLTFLTFLAFLPCTILAAETKNYENDISVHGKERVMRACVHADSKELERCMQRQKRNATAVWGKSNPVTALNFYDTQDWGMSHLRYRLTTNRLVGNQQYWSINRKTFAEFTPREDINTKRLPYVNTVRQEELECMYVAAGRPRALCLDRQRDAAQKMKAPIAQE